MDQETRDFDIHLGGADLQQPVSARHRVKEISASSPLRPRTVYGEVRRVCELALVDIALVPLLPLFLAISVVIMLDSRGPAIFRQRRVGYRGREFDILKFRTMAAECPSYSLKVSPLDPQITRVGRVLRRSHLDELPQLVNILRGEMTLIGPRPEQSALWSLYAPWQRQRVLVRPGLTGWWQVNHRDSSPMHHNVEEDLYYIQHQGLGLDLRIAARTVELLAAGLGSEFGRLWSRVYSLLTRPQSPAS